jgi:poly(3-hydroxybutyrate) depolymerase
MTAKKLTVFRYPEVGVPFLWPFSFFIGLEEAEIEAVKKNLEFLGEVEKTQLERPEPEWTTPNMAVLELHVLKLRNFSREAQGTITLVLPPYAGHTSMIADFYRGQSLIESLLAHGLTQLYAIEWKSATPVLKDYDIDNYLAELNVCVDDMGGKVNLIGLCQGGWMAAMYAARYPAKVQTLVLAGSPIDTDAGEGQIKDYAHRFPMSFFEELVQVGNGLLKGAFMLEGFKNLHPEQHYIEKFVELYEHIDDPAYRHRFECFERWYEYTIDLPGRWYLQAVKELFKENRLTRGEFIALGKRMNLKDIRCPAYLLAGKQDDITPKEQVFGAKNYLGTASADIVEDLAEGGHIGLFMGKKAISDNWCRIANWIKQNSPSTRV